MTRYKNPRKKCFRFFMDIARFPVNKGGGLSVEAIQFFEDMLLAKAPAKLDTQKVPTSVKNGFENAASSDYGILDSNQPNHATTHGLVCPDCLVEHCRHCKCENCCKQWKKALANQANGKANTVKTWKELGEVMKGKKVNPPQNRVVYPHNDLDNAVRIDNQWAEDLQDSKPKKVKEIRGLTKTLVAVAPGTEYLEVTSIGDIRVKTVKGIKHGAGYSQVIVDEVSIGDITTLLKNK